jgi:hypothetical protein
MTKLEKLEYYVEKLTRDLSDENVSEFLYDRTECAHKEDNDIFCPFCSAGCFKRRVLGVLSVDAAQKVLHKMYYINSNKKKKES